MNEKKHGIRDDRNRRRKRRVEPKNRRKYQGAGREERE